VVVGAAQCKGSPEDWEVVSRKANYPWFGVILIFFDLGHSSVTQTVRQKSTGITRRVTADNEREAADCIANGWFDAAGAR